MVKELIKETGNLKQYREKNNTGGYDYSSVHKTHEEKKEGLTTSQKKLADDIKVLRENGLL